MAFIRKFESKDHNFTLVIDDDDRVAYAYLLDEGKIIADVWLYNRAATPEKPEWGDRSKAPFLNPREFVREQLSTISDATPVVVDWVGNKDTLERAEININNELLAVISPGSKPGWCRNARKSG